MPAHFLVFLLFGLPFIVFQFGISAFETPKVLVAEILIELLLLNAIFRNQLNLKNISKPAIFLIFGLFVISLIQTINSGTYNFFGNAFRLQGILLLWHLLVFSLLAGHIALEKRYKWTYFASCACIFLSGLIMGINPSGRIIGVLGEPNALASVLVIFLPLIAYYHKKPVFLIALIMTLITIYLTRSRSAGLALIVIAVFYFLNARLKISLKTSTLISGLIILLTLTTPFISQISSAGMPVDPLERRYEDRSDIWRAAYLAGLQNPIFGSGFGTVEQAIHRSAQRLSINIQFAVIDSSHNFLLDYFVQGGLVGLGIILSLIYISFKNLIIQQKTLEVSMLLAVITVMLFNPVSVVILILFWWLIGRGITRTSYSILTG